MKALSRHGRARLGARVQGATTVLLVVALAVCAAWLSERHRVRWDATAAARNTLSEASVAVLDTLDSPFHVDAYVREDEVHRRAVEELIERFRQATPDVTLRFVNPDRVPDEVRRLGITTEGELVVTYGGRTERVVTLGEEALINALHRLGRSTTRWIAAASGHGERDWRGRARFELGTLTAELESRGYAVRPVDLSTVTEVPENASILALTQATRPLAPPAIDAIERHLERGGSVLWLGDPGGQAGLERIGEALGVRVVPGVLMDPVSRSPQFVEVSSFGSHPITRGLEGALTFPVAAGLAWERRPGWTVGGLASSGLRSWSESAPDRNPVSFDAASEPAGPFDLAIAMERPGPAERTQRIVVVGDADFASNGFIGARGNLALVVRAIEWLGHEDEQIEVPPRRAGDQAFEPDAVERILIALGPPVALPLLLAIAGILTWRRRRG